MADLPVNIATLPILTMDRAIAYTGKSRSTIERAVKNKTLKRYGRVGKTWTFRRTDLDRWLGGK